MSQSRSLCCKDSSFRKTGRQVDKNGKTEGRCWKTAPRGAEEQRAGPCPGPAPDWPQTGTSSSTGPRLVVDVSLLGREPSL